MQAILLALSILALLAGAAMIGFGIPVNEFGIGNTLIMVGTTAMVGGLILIGLWILARSVARIADAVDLRAPNPATTRVSAPSRPAETAPPLADNAAIANLSRVLAEPPLDFSEPADSGSPRLDPFAPAKPAADQAGPRVRGFGALWSRDPARGSRSSRPAEAPNPTETNEPAEPASPGPQAITVLKSGVIEGMAYTLYSDGAIEADLKQGMVRFSSIDDLRRHLAAHE